MPQIFPSSCKWKWHVSKQDGKPQKIFPCKVESLIFASHLNNVLLHRIRLKRIEQLQFHTYISVPDVLSHDLFLWKLRNFRMRTSLQKLEWKRSESIFFPYLKRFHISSYFRNHKLMSKELLFLHLIRKSLIGKLYCWTCFLNLQLPQEKDPLGGPHIPSLAFQWGAIKLNL